VTAAARAMSDGISGVLSGGAIPAPRLDAQLTRVVATTMRSIARTNDLTAVLVAVMRLHQSMGPRVVAQPVD
jgi:hypothetical protein